MHRQSWAPSNLLPLKALHSHPGWKEVKEKATHMVKCKGPECRGVRALPKNSLLQAGSEGSEPRGLGRQGSRSQAAPQRP